MHPLYYHANKWASQIPAPCEHLFHHSAGDISHLCLMVLFFKIYALGLGFLFGWFLIKLNLSSLTSANLVGVNFSWWYFILHNVTRIFSLSHTLTSCKAEKEKWREKKVSLDTTLRFCHLADKVGQLPQAPCVVSDRERKKHFWRVRHSPKCPVPFPLSSFLPLRSA